ncbi:MAG TPA: hypothetical protein VMK32_01730 [Burkholderiaceae bacterium]|nr:hypothetical protein [Burkholderiaceae bacterium]
MGKALVVKAGQILSAALIGLLLTAATAQAQMTLTLYAAYVGSDGVENVTTNTQADIRSSAAFAVAGGYVLDDGREVQLLYSQQATTLDPGGGAAPFDLTIRYLHLGGTVFFDAPGDRGAYVVGGLGATQFSPSTSGYGTEFKPSINLGLGYLWPLGQHVALRAEARGFATFVNSSGGFLCSGGCIVVLRSDVFWQYSAMVGLTAKF